MAAFLLKLKTVDKHYCLKKNVDCSRNNPIIKIIIGLLFFTCWTKLYAADFVVNNISYDVVSMSDLTCEVAPGTYPINDKVVIPATVTFKSRTFTVIGIGDRACKDKYIEGVTIPNGIQYIGKEAFEGNNLKKIVIPGSVTTIKASAFHWNNVSVVNMKTIYNPIELVLEDSDEELVGNKDDIFQWLPFSDCNLEKIYIGRNINKQLIADQIVTLTKEIEIGDKVKELTTDRLNNNMFKDFNSLEKVTKVSQVMAHLHNLT